MCGILCTIGNNDIKYDANDLIKTLEARGPEGTNVININDKVIMGFTRLAINGLTNFGMQPYKNGNLYWICNGEIYNSKEIEKELGLHNTGSDCQCIGDLYMRHRDNLSGFVRALDGVFSLILYDSDIEKLIVTRDPFGVRPLFFGCNKNNNFITNKPDSYIFASELKAIIPYFQQIYTFLPGTIQSYDVNTSKLIYSEKYHNLNWITNPMYMNNEKDLIKASRVIRFSLENAVSKRLMTERPIACLLSGGLDSSLIASIVQKNLRNLGLPSLKTYSIGFSESKDLEYARIVSRWIGSDHTEVIMTPDDFFNAIPEVIKAIESYDTTTVRASTGNYLIAKYIKQLSDCKVIFNGDGSDELFGGYLYFNNAPNDIEFHKETERLLNDIHYFDVLRSDRSISSNGLEARTPFLDKQFVALVRSIHPNLLKPIINSRIEKYILRQAFNDGITLPSEVLWRRKEAFSDGVSSPQKSWYQEIQDRLSKIIPDNWNTLDSVINHLNPKTKEEYYYRSIFIHFYGIDAIDVTVPYRWMPKWCPETTDPSARTLTLYNI